MLYLRVLEAIKRENAHMTVSDLLAAIAILISFASIGLSIFSFLNERKVYLLNSKFDLLDMLEREKASIDALCFRIEQISKGFEEMGQTGLQEKASNLQADYKEFISSVEPCIDALKGVEPSLKFESLKVLMELRHIANRFISKTEYLEHNLKSLETIISDMENLKKKNS